MALVKASRLNRISEDTQNELDHSHSIGAPFAFPNSLVAPLLGARLGDGPDNPQRGSHRSADPIRSEGGLHSTNATPFQSLAEAWRRIVIRIG
eukprot:6179768-Pleurochrysis_carterae.AAC.2